MRLPRCIRPPPEALNPVGPPPPREVTPVAQPRAIVGAGCLEEAGPSRGCPPFPVGDAGGLQSAGSSGLGAASGALGVPWPEGR